MKRRLIALLLAALLLTACGDDCHTRVKQECLDNEHNEATCQEMARLTCED